MRFRTVILLSLIVTTLFDTAHAQWSGSASDVGRGFVAAPGEPGLDPDRPALVRPGRRRMALGVHVPFGIRELATPSFAAGFTWRGTSVDTGLDHRSFDAYKAVRIHVLMGRFLHTGGRFTSRVGVMVRVVHERLGLLGTRRSLESRAGILMTHASGVSMAAHAGAADVTVDASWKTPTPWPMPMASVRLHPVHGWTVSSGLDWQLVGMVRCRAGFRNRPETLTAGLGLQLPVGISIDWAMASVPGPGWSTWMAVRWQS